MFNNYLHVNFSSTLVGVTLLSSQLTFWIITPQWWRHWRPILIELRSFPFIFSLLPGGLAQAKTGRKRTAVMTGIGWRSTSLIKKTGLDCIGALPPWELAPVAGPIPPHLQPRSLTDKRQGFLCRRGCRLSRMSPGGRERCLATNSHSSALAELLPSDPSSNNAASSRPSTQFSRRAESAGWLRD